MNNELNVLVVDDSSLYRSLIATAVNSIDGVKLAGFAKTGQEAITKIALNKPDIITLDIEMPIMDGLSCLKFIQRKWREIPVLMLSSLTKAGAASTMEALERGAFGFIPKPNSSTAGEELEVYLRNSFKE